MKAAIFDLPKMAEEAAANIRKHGMEDRMAVLAGDFDLDPIGCGHISRRQGAATRLGSRELMRMQIASALGLVCD
jgi:hypothetical protein